MSADTPEIEQEKSEQKQQAKRTADAANRISATLESVADQLSAFIHQHQSDNQTERAQRQKFEAKELFWTRFAAIAATVAALAGLILSGVSVRVLYETLGVYRGQERIMDKQTDIANTQVRDFEAVQAASISILNFQIQNFPNQPMAAYDLVARGQTGAQHVAAGSMGMSIPRERETAFFCDPKTEFTVNVQPKPGYGLSLSPADGPKHYAYTLFRPMTADDVKAVMSDQLDFFLVVAVGYYDVFGKHHRVSDCLVYQARVGKFMPCTCQHERRD